VQSEKVTHNEEVKQTKIIKRKTRISYYRNHIDGLKLFVKEIDPTRWRRNSNKDVHKEANKHAKKQSIIKKRICKRCNKVCLS
jgi:hypothetical protein